LVNGSALTRFKVMAAPAGAARASRAATASADTQASGRKAGVPIMGVFVPSGRIAASSAAHQRVRRTGLAAASSGSVGGPAASGLASRRRVRRRLGISLRLPPWCSTARPGSEPALGDQPGHEAASAQEIDEAAVSGHLDVYEPEPVAL
jgi:hypothetical protein